MELTWLGTAGFIIKGKEGEIAFDPFLSRGPGSKSPFGVEAFANSRALFVGHGHFDHTYDIPRIAQHSDVQVYAPGLTGHVLKMRGVDSKRVVTALNKEVLFAPYKMRAFHSQHVRFDQKLVLSTLKRCGVKGCLHMAHLGLGYPKGLVQTYMFEMASKKVLFISSAGCSDEELKVYRQLEVDYLLAPLQGHSEIQDVAARQTSIIAPKAVIPHHHDDFYAPLSQSISVEGFRERLKDHGYRGQVLEIPLFRSGTL